jgi:two-component system sensor histidine kinase PilS (NtrC family)
MRESPVRRKLVALMVVRLIISTILLGSAILIELNAGSRSLTGPLYVLIGTTFALSAVYASTLRLSDRWPWFVDLQLSADALIVSTFIWITGGVASYFSSLYVLPIIGASALQLRRGGVLLAVFSTLLYVALVIAQYFYGATLGSSVVLPTIQVAQYTVAINVLGFLAVGLLSGSLAERLRHADVRLAHASTEIAALQALNQHIIDSMTMGIVTTGMDGRVATFNRTAEKLTGLAADGVMGQQVADVLQLTEEFHASLAVNPEAPLSRRAEYVFQTADGRAMDVGISAAYLVTSSGPSGLLLTFQDVTATKKLARDARIQQRLAAVGEMAAGMAHEIRNPLASMSGSIQVLRKELPLTDDQAQLMDIVLRESERLNQTIRGFMAYARPQRFEISRLDLRPLLNDTALLLRNSSEVHDEHVVDVDAPDQPVWCDADEGQVRQIVWNLATNGLRAMPSGGRLRLSARLEQNGRARAVLTVEDEGIGIPEEELDMIFQPFRGTFARGSGLGMAIVHRIVSDYSGEIQVKSKPGAGTTVQVRLPVQAATSTGSK